MFPAEMGAVAVGTVSQLPLTISTDEVRWFHPWGAVTEFEDGRCAVQLGGVLLGWFARDDRDRSMRNVLLVTLANVPTMHFEHLATAFGVTDRYLWVLRKKAATGGIAAVLLSRTGGKSSVSEQKRRQLRAWFEEGMTPTEATRRQGRRGKKLSRATISRERAKWLAEKTATAVESAIAALPPPSQDESGSSTGEASTVRSDAARQLDLFANTNTTTDVETSDPKKELPTVSTSSSSEPTCDDGNRSIEEQAPDVAVTDAAEADASEEPSGSSAASINNATTVDDMAGELEGETTAAIGSDRTAPGDESKPVMPQYSQPPRSGRLVQHAGTWIMMALAHRAGLHEEAAAIAGVGDSVRIALDAILAALAIGERTVEGVRRIATPSAPVLLRVGHTPTASGIRRRLWNIGEQGGNALLARMSSRYIAEHATSGDEPVVTCWSRLSLRRSQSKSA